MGDGIICHRDSNAIVREVGALHAGIGNNKIAHTAFLFDGFFLLDLHRSDHLSFLKVNPRHPTSVSVPFLNQGVIDVLEPSSIDRWPQEVCDNLSLGSAIWIDLRYKDHSCIPEGGFVVGGEIFTTNVWIRILMLGWRPTCDLLTICWGKGRKKWWTHEHIGYEGIRTWVLCFDLEFTWAEFTWALLAGHRKVFLFGFTKIQGRNLYTFPVWLNEICDMNKIIVIIHSTRFPAWVDKLLHKLTGTWANRNTWICLLSHNNKQLIKFNFHKSRTNNT